MKSVFNKDDVAETIELINRLRLESKAQWGKMSVGQMLTHCNVGYEMVYTDKYPRPNIFIRLIMKIFVKNKVVREKPFAKNLPASPQFKMLDIKDFEFEKKRLINFIIKTQELGEEHFDGKISNSFGKLNKTEWNNMFYKHLNYHLTQFGV